MFFFSQQSQHYRKATENWNYKIICGQSYYLLLFCFETMFLEFQLCFTQYFIACNMVIGIFRFMEPFLFCILYSFQELFKFHGFPGQQLILFLSDSIICNMDHHLPLLLSQLCLESFILSWRKGTPSALQGLFLTLCSGVTSGGAGCIKGQHARLHLCIILTLGLCF